MIHPARHFLGYHFTTTRGYMHTERGTIFRPLERALTRLRCWIRGYHCFYDGPSSRGERPITWKSGCMDCGKADRRKVRFS